MKIKHLVLLLLIWLLLHQTKRTHNTLVWNLKNIELV